MNVCDASFWDLLLYLGFFIIYGGLVAYIVYKANKK